MPDADIALFVAASLAVIIAPGPDNVYVVTRGVAQGRRVALASAWGMCSGLLFRTPLSPPWGSRRYWRAPLLPPR